MTIELRTALRIASLLVTCIGLTVAGSVLAFSSYIVAMKKHFNCTQSTVEVMASMVPFGFSCGFPAGVMSEKVSARWTAFTGVVIATTGYALLYSATQMQTFYKTKPWLLCVYLFMAAVGSISLALPCLRTGMMNFHPQHRGKVYALMDAFLSGGPALFSYIYWTIYAKGHLHDEQNQNLGGYFLMMSIVASVCGCLVVICLQEFHLDSSDPEMNMDVQTSNSDDHNPEHNSGNSKMKPITGCRLIRRFDFQFLFWSFVFGGGLHAMFLGNQAMYLKSFNMEEYTVLFTSLSPISASITKLVVGVLSDAMIHRVSRVFILLICNAIQTVILIIVIFTANYLSVFAILDITISSANGVLFCLTPTIISELYGMDYFARNWGGTLIGGAFGAIVLQRMFGWIYDSNIRTKGSTDCTGLHCFTWSFIMIAVVSFCSVIFNLGLLQRIAYNKKKKEGK